jgi:hypothetical protein
MASKDARSGDGEAAEMAKQVVLMARVVAKRIMN